MAEKINTPVFGIIFFISTNIRLIAKMGKPKAVKAPTMPIVPISKSISLFFNDILFLSYVFLKLRKSLQKKPNRTNVKSRK